MIMNNKAKTSPFMITIPVAGIIIGIVIAGWGFYNNRDFYHDDAYISLRYAYNLINGHGITWNPGEYVEGYTNFLHLACIGMLGACGIELVPASQLINIAAFLALNVFLVFYFYSRTLAGRALTLLPAILTLTAFPLIVWCLGGLEGPLFTLFCTLGVCFFADRPETKSYPRYLACSGLFFAMACMTRPDGIIFFSISLLFLAIGRNTGKIKFLMFFTVPFVSVYASYFVWRLLYYKTLLPNTFYAKATDLTPAKLLNGLNYMWDYMTVPPFLFFLLLPVLVYTLYQKSFKRPCLYILVCILSYLLFIVYVGGDHMQVFRFMLPVIPLCGILLYLTINTVAANSKRSLLFIVYAFILSCSGLQCTYNDLNPRKPDPAAYLGALAGKYIAATWPQNSLIALNTAGSTPFYATHNTYIDMLGLNDRHIARRKISQYILPWQKVPGHAKGDGSYVLDRKPDYIIIGGAQGDIIGRPWFLSDWEIAQDPRFYKNYRFHYVILSNQENGFHKRGYYFQYYQRIKDENNKTAD